MKGIVFLIIIANVLEVVVCSCTLSWNANDWSHWSTCTKTCGGGTRSRTRKCVWGSDEKQRENCNQFCYHGGQYIGGHCNCKSWRTGQCCQDCHHISIAHCKSGKQSCGGSPDNIKCTDCFLPYTPAGYGKGCRRLSCKEQNGGCEHTCLTDRGGATCSCRNGFKLLSNGFSCSDINECSTGQAKCNHYCNNTLGSFKCSCKAGYELDRDGFTCSRRRSCKEQNGGCEHTCLTDRGGATCSCRNGFKLLSNGYSCSDINECSTGQAKCNHYCNNTLGSFKCSCKAGYELNRDGFTCSDIDECVTGEAKCEKRCTNLQGSYSCGCQPGFLLNETKCVDINECTINNGGCSHSCVNEDGSYHCTCNDGYILDTDGKSCSDIDECHIKTDKCSQHCANEEGGYTCSCDAGYEIQSDGYSCKDIDDCIGVDCMNGGSCIDNLKSYNCKCKRGFTGVHCENDIDECDGFLNGGCEEICTNTVGSFTCSCHQNQTLASNGLSCSGGSKQDSIFSRYGLIRKLLPRGCFTILISRCTEGSTVDLLMSSTSPWYRLDSNHSVMYSHGIIFVELNSLALPISLTGIQISNANGELNLITGSLSLSTKNGTEVGEERTYECVSLTLSPHDVIELIESQSFLKTFFNNLLDHLPDWLTFSSHGTDFLDVRDLRTELIYGKNLSRFPACKGAPVYDNRLYTVLEFGGNFSMSLYGNNILLPKPVASHKFCILIDICQDKGGSLFIMIPEESRQFLDNVSLFHNLTTRYGLVFRPIGLGLSLFQHINVISQSSDVQMWNGDRLFKYRIAPEANFWMEGNIAMTLGKTFQLHLNSHASVFASVPSVPNLLQSLFLEEWDILFRMNLIGSIDLRFKLLGKEQNIHLPTVANSELTAYASVGGTKTRAWCGEQANPSGFFLSLMLDINPFLDVPVLRYFGIDLNSNVYAFLASNPNLQNVSENHIDIFEDVLNLKETVGFFVNRTVKNVFRYANLLTNESLVLLKEVDQAANDFEQSIKALMNGTKDIFKNIELFVNQVSTMWSTGWKTFENSISAFNDSLVNTTDIVKQDYNTFFNKALERIKENLKKVLTKVNDQLMSLLNDVEGFGLRFKTSLRIFHIKIAGLEVEFVYSVNQLGSCSRFAHVYKLLENEPAARLYGVVSFPYIIAPFLSVDLGSGVGMAISLDHPDRFLFQLHAEASLLGITAQADVLISNLGYEFSFEGSVWNTFKARLVVSYNAIGSGILGEISVIGTFLANANDGSSFQDSYLGALQKITKSIADEADLRIKQVQNAFTKAQDGLTKAQKWLDEKKVDLRGANTDFDNAVAALERAKDKVEEAKEPFKNAINTLNEAQRKVDRLCTIRNCKQICVPGLKCKIRWKKVWFLKMPYPSCHLTDCMFSFPDPICIAFNLGCRAVRGIAYLALEVAKVAVHIPMLALDAAKLVLDGAKFLVDKSRVVLVLAEGALDLASFGLEGAKGLLEGAKVALEGIKVVVGWGIKALNLIIEYGIGSIIDMRNCGFVLTASVESPAFLVRCEINMFRTGFRNVSIGINFGNHHQSIWQASKKTLDAFIDETRLADRKKREIQFMTTKVINRFIRDIRNDNIENLEEFDANKTLDVLSRTPGFEGNGTFSDYETRVQYFKAKCTLFQTSYGFFKEATQLLFEMTDETANVLTNTSDLSDQLSGFNMDNMMQNVSIEEMGIDPVVGANEFNLSMDAINDALLGAKRKLNEDPMLQGIDSLAKQSKSMLQNQSADVNNMKVINHWIVGMNNISGEYFDDEKCLSFMDCAHYVITELYGLFDAENITNMDKSIEAISNFEDVLLDLTANNSHTIIEVRNFTEQLRELLEILDNLNMFCSQAPQVIREMKNQRVVKGTTLELDCGISGHPAPTIWWYSEDEYLSEYEYPVLTIHNVSSKDSRKYRCVAGNIVANLSSETVEVIVLDEEPFFPDLFQNESLTSTSEPKILENKVAESGSHLTIILSVTMVVLVTIIVIVIIAVYRYYTRRKSRKEGVQAASTVSINSWMTSNMVAPNVKKDTGHKS